jgi:hypothetical protein
MYRTEAFDAPSVYTPLQIASDMAKRKDLNHRLSVTVIHKLFQNNVLQDFLRAATPLP